jgi:hypothetical protein
VPAADHVIPRRRKDLVGTENLALVARFFLRARCETAERASDSSE